MSPHTFPLYLPNDWSFKAEYRTVTILSCPLNSDDFEISSINVLLW